METQSSAGGLLTADMPTETPLLRKARTGIIARFLHGTGAGTVAYALGIASNLLLLPLYLRFWSVAAYGEWMALYSVVNYLANLDFGVTTAAINAATIAYARGDWQTFKRIQGTAWATSLAIAGLGGLMTGALSMLYFRVNRWLGLTTLNPHEARFVFCGLAISLLANIPGKQLIAVYTATGEFAKYQWLYNAYSLFTCIATAFALCLGFGPALLASVIAATTLFTMAFSLWLLRLHGGRLFPHLQDSDWQTVRRLAAPTGQFGISMIANALAVQGPIIVLSRALGGPAVALFTTTRTVSNIVRGTVILLRAPLRPEFGAASAHANKDALQRLFRLTVSIDTVVAITLSAILWSGGVWLIEFWSHGRIHPDPLLLHLLLIASALEGFLQILAVAGWATNRIRAVSVGLLATAVLSLVLSVALVGRYGLLAVPLSTLAPLIVVMIPVATRNASHAVHLPLRFVILRLLVPFIIVAVLSFVLPAWIARVSFVAALPSAIVSSSAVCALTLFTVCTFFLTRNDRQALRDRIFR